MGKHKKTFIAMLMTTVNDRINIFPDFHEYDAWACSHTPERAHVFVTKIDCVSEGALCPMVLF